MIDSENNKTTKQTVIKPYMCLVRSMFRILQHFRKRTSSVKHVVCSDTISANHEAALSAPESVIFSLNMFPQAMQKNSDSETPYQDRSQNGLRHDIFYVMGGLVKV